MPPDSTRNGVVAKQTPGRAGFNPPTTATHSVAILAQNVRPSFCSGASADGRPMKKSTTAKKAMKKGMKADGMKTGAQTAKKATKKSMKADGMKTGAQTAKKAMKKGMTDTTARFSGGWGFHWLDFLDHLEREGRS